MTDRTTGFAATARAFAIYSLVPYLGILFCPGALVVGGLGVVKYRKSDSANKGACYVSIAIGFLVLLIQCFFWWILYNVSEWSKVL